jgi:membrane dipeptidase
MNFTLDTLVAMFCSAKKGRLACVLAMGFAVALAALPCDACFSIVVGKNASSDGCVLVGHNEDDGPPQIVNHHKLPRQTYPAGATVTLRNGGVLEQASQTWSCIWSEMPGMPFSDSYVNEWGVTVCSDNCPSREDKPELTDGGIGWDLRRLVAQRARTAREGVLLAGRLVERFGYVDSGRTYVIADPAEGWLFCAVNGKHWLARRVPDDEVAMVANTYTIRTVALEDADSVLASKDILEYAKSRGWCDPTAGTFDFAAAYASPQAASHPNNTGRQWSGLCYVTGKPLTPGPDLPFSVVPRNKLSAADVMQILRHDKETESSPVPADSPFLCSLCSGATQTSFVAQLRTGLPADIGLVYWVCLASPRTSFYIPFHFGIADFPLGYRLEPEQPTAEAYDRKVQAEFTANPREAFWTFSNFRDKMDRKDAVTMQRLHAEQQRIERQAVETQGPIEEAANRLYGNHKTAALRLLENYSKGVYMSTLEAMSKSLDGPETDADLRRRANELAHEILLIDTHLDTPFELEKRMQDISGRIDGGHFDYVRARQGGLDALFMAVYVSPQYEEKGGARAYANRTIEMIEGFARQWPEQFILARSPDDVRAQFGDNRVSILMGIENGAPLEGDLANVQRFYDHGIRYITLVHSTDNHICDSSFDDQTRWHGLSPFGKKLIPWMNRVGMIVDVSHVSDEAFYQIVEISRAPVVATHSSCRHFTPGWERNLSDDMIRLLAGKGGVIQINFGSMFVDPTANREFVEVHEEVRQHIRNHRLQGEERKRYVRERWGQVSFSKAYVSDVAAHIDHAVQLVGVDHVGLGSDFDGVTEVPVGLEDVSCYPNLIAELLKKGYSEGDIRKIAGENFLRVWTEIERVAGRLRSET